MSPELISEVTRRVIEEKIGTNDILDAENFISSNTKLRLTPEGGLGVLMTNKTGAASVKGTVVAVNENFNNAVKAVLIDLPNAIGVIYEDGVADGEEVIVILSGVAETLFVNNTTAGHLARVTRSDDSVSANGKAISEAYPAPPFASDKHFMEIGHVIETSTSGTAKVILHFN